MPKLTIDAEKLHLLLKKMIDDCTSGIMEQERFYDLEEAFPEVKEEKWVPKFAEKYWFVDNDFSASYTLTTNSIDERRISVGNCFPTEQSCQEAIEKIKKLLAK